MSRFRIPFLSPRDEAAGSPPAETNRPTLLLENDEGREAFLAYATRHLAEGECIVEVRDLASSRRAFTTRPLDPQAELVAQRVPILLRGSLLSHVSYFRVRMDDLRAAEKHFEQGEFSHEYEVKLRPLVVGAVKGTSPLAA